MATGQRVRNVLFSVIASLQSITYELAVWDPVLHGYRRPSSPMWAIEETESTLKEGTYNEKPNAPCRSVGN